MHQYASERRQQAERIQGFGPTFGMREVGRKPVGAELPLSNGSTLKWGCHRSRIRLILLVRDCTKYSAECFKSVTCRTYFSWGDAFRVYLAHGSISRSFCGQENKLQCARRVIGNSF